MSKPMSPITKREFQEVLEDCLKRDGFRNARKMMTWNETKAILEKKIVEDYRNEIEGNTPLSIFGVPD